MIVNFFTELNISLFFYFHDLLGYSELFSAVVYVIAKEIDWYVIIAGVFFILINEYIHNRSSLRIILRRSFIENIYIFIGICIAWAISLFMKINFAIPRPFIQFPETIPLFVYGAYDSFPSGHATLFSALGTALFFYNKKIGIIFLFFALIIGLTRIIAGIHFPLDVLMGWCIGAFVSYLSYYFLQKNKTSC